MVKKFPRVLMAILAKQKEPVLPYYLECIEALKYPKKAISLYVHTNNNTDRTADILQTWISKIGDEYGRVEFINQDVPINVEQYGVHEWNADRFRVLGAIRQNSLKVAQQQKCDFYFTADVDNFIVPETLSSLVDTNLPIVAPLLIHSTSMYSNFHAAIDANGYYADSPYYAALLRRDIRGLVEVPVVHCTYLVRADALPFLSYDDGSCRHEYVIFSASARKAKIPQYLDTRQAYGYLTCDEDDKDVKYRMASLSVPLLPLVTGEEVFHSWYRPGGEGSGPGSTPEFTYEYRRFLEDFMMRHEVQSVVDYGCGDWQWSKLVDWGTRKYYGFDIVPNLVDRLRRDHGSDTRTFNLIDKDTEIPFVDLILCKDVLQHLSNEEVVKLVEKLSKCAKHLLFVNDRSPSVSSNNHDIQVGGWREIDLSLPPFNLLGEYVFDFRAHNKMTFHYTPQVANP